MSTSETSPVAAALVAVLSAAAHAGAWLALGAIPPTSVHAANVAVVELIDRPSPRELEAQPKPEPPPPEEADPEPTVARAAARRPAPREAAPPPPADLTGVTLTNADGSWASVVGNGQAMEGPLGPIAAARPREVRPVTTTAAPTKVRGSGPRTVEASDLSRPPSAPDLNGSLAHYYPAAERAAGVEGRALMSVEILPSGRVGRISVVNATAPAFADACRNTLRASNWSPPLDRAGAAVATHIRYDCRFEVR